MSNGSRPRQQAARASELALFPFTASLRLRVRVTLLLMGGLACALAVALGERALYVLAVFLVFCDVPIELGFSLVRRRRATVYDNGEDQVATVVRKRAFPIGPQFAVVVRYAARGTVVQSSRHIPFNAWLPLRIGDSLHIRVDRERPTNWVLCWEEKGPTAGSSSSVT